MSSDDTVNTISCSKTQPLLFSPEKLNMFFNLLILAGILAQYKTLSRLLSISIFLKDFVSNLRVSADTKISGKIFKITLQNPPKTYIL